MKYPADSRRPTAPGISLLGKTNAGKRQDGENKELLTQRPTARPATASVSVSASASASLSSQREVRAHFERRYRDSKAAKDAHCTQSSGAITINLGQCKYGLLHEVAAAVGWCISTSRESSCSLWDVLWTDGGHGVEKVVRSMKAFQRVNHFPGMVQLYRKDLLARNMQFMRALVGKSEFSFTPRTWVLPRDLSAVSEYLRTHTKACVIVKPSTGSQGRGISLATRPEQLQQVNDSCVVQTYLQNPLLIDGFKFDLRIYVLVISCEPLRVLLFRNGLCRLCTAPYRAPSRENLHNTFMHLTNYSINKHNEKFVQNNEYSQTCSSVASPSGSDKAGEKKEGSESGSKRSIAWLRQWLESEGVSFDDVWRDIAHVVVKTILVGLPALQRGMRSAKVDGQNTNPFTCFELLGFDVILTDSLQPVLLEVNHMPSFSADSELDRAVKSSLISQTLSLLGVSPKERASHAHHMAQQAQLRLYGDLFDAAQRRSSSANKRGNKKDATRFFSAESYWSRYLEGEAKYFARRDDLERTHLAHSHDCFDLVFPARDRDITAPYSKCYMNILRALSDPRAHVCVGEEKYSPRDSTADFAVRGSWSNDSEEDVVQTNEHLSQEEEAEESDDDRTRVVQKEIEFSLIEHESVICSAQNNTKAVNLVHAECSEQSEVMLLEEIDRISRSVDQVLGRADSSRHHEQVLQALHPPDTVPSPRSPFQGSHRVLKESSKSLSVEIESFLHDKKEPIQAKSSNISSPRGGGTSVGDSQAHSSPASPSPSDFKISTLQFRRLHTLLEIAQGDDLTERYRNYRDQYLLSIQQSMKQNF